MHHIWQFIILQENGLFAFMVGIVSKMAGYAIIYDTNLCITNLSNNPLIVGHKIHQSITLWECLLLATGGTLLPEKFFWYLVNFKFQGSQWSNSCATHKSTSG